MNYPYGLKNRRKFQLSVRLDEVFAPLFKIERVLEEESHHTEMLCIIARIGRDEWDLPLTSMHVFIGEEVMTEDELSGFVFHCDDRIHGYWTNDDEDRYLMHVDEYIAHVEYKVEALSPELREGMWSYLRCRAWFSSLFFDRDCFLAVRSRSQTYRVRAILGDALFAQLCGEFGLSFHEIENFKDDPVPSPQLEISFAS